MNTIVLNATEAFQLAALGPCFAILVYLLFSLKNLRNFTKLILPILFFSSLTCSFLLPILAIFPEIDSHKIRTVLIFNEHMEPELGFLFILQLILRKPTPIIYWTILALPLVGGGHFLNLSILQQEVCIEDGGCIDSEMLLVLYRVISASFVFLLLVPVMRRMPKIRKGDTSRQHKYWLIIMLIAYNLAILALGLLIVAEKVSSEEVLFLKTMLGVSFIYLVLSSVFRVFDKEFNLKSLRGIVTDKDRKIADDIIDIINVDYPYRDLNFNRGLLADQLGLTEQHLSHVINSVFKKSFSELMNEYRINDAKTFLEEGNNSITAISFDVGFSSITSFNRVFKGATGVSPSAYRTKYLKKAS